MRELKFRVWTGEAMVTPAFITRKGVAHWSENSVTERSSDIMQFTGLKDKNGVEIYEGDIVKLCYGIPPTYDILKVEYADDEYFNDISVSGWWLRNIRANGCSSSLCKSYENDLEVIGTIYQNPELLK